LRERAGVRVGLGDFFQWSNPIHEAWAVSGHADTGGAQ
jgi:hypothetical protein